MPFFKSGVSSFACSKFVLKNLLFSFKLNTRLMILLIFPSTTAQFSFFNIADMEQEM